ncbi:RagB/SusD family nutrient uptake outer membrane protein [Fulvivirga maritima]|uniref:RagB/SusD family nutrient uptake outer membrane protein n=1 Tax=Fulvivirga maritima TaxID=2904247 RepID=UPI001F318A0E|nr:RagB/SusD family nutrient uptake outer membrane protein [Fulvivirga maritima]UII24991.1 RagB/SusD family nutrient uptake outer membrane protein [Fulvivirga maritima]
MKKLNINRLFLVGILSLLALSCGDLDLKPENQITSDVVYDDFGNYKNVLAKLYGGYALTGQQGNQGGDPDIIGLDEGFSDYLRLYYNLQELSTDEAVISWNDGSLPDIVTVEWIANNEFIGAMFSRIYFQVALANEFIREMSDENLDSRGLTEAQKTEARIFRAEARFIRALSYWHALDMFGDIALVKEEDGVGSYFPERVERITLFEYIESELLAIQNELIDARQNEYGRADKAAAWTLLTKLYLNAQVYTGVERNSEAITYASHVIDAGYTLDPNYDHLFLADNNSAEGIIFSINYDGTNTQTNGGTKYLILGSIIGSMNQADYGMSERWPGLRTTKNIVNLFDDITGATDSRAMFHADGQTLEINDFTQPTQGYPVTKFKNITSTGEPGSNMANSFPDTDFPMFRLADVYLMYAEAVLRGGTGGSTATALEYINALRERAYGDESGNISAEDLTLDFILDERARELCYEMHRRTDLIRFGKFSNSDYVWPWKGGVQEGRPVDSRFDLFPIPTAAILANPNLKQHDGY